MINFLKLWNRSGKQYQEYALKFPQYKKTNEKLVEISNIKPNQIIVDLACGTGLTTKEVLKKYPNIKKIYAVDFSKDMIEVAKKSVQSKKVVFIVSDAQDINKFIPENVDVVICNSAFWQFQNQAKVLNTISNILKKHGKFIFNLNQQFFDFGKPELNQKILINTIFSEMKKRDYEPSRKIKSKIDEEKLEDLFSKAGFTLDKTEILNIGPRKLEDFLGFSRFRQQQLFLKMCQKKPKNKFLILLMKN